MSTLGTSKIASLSNCVVLPKLYDSYSGILYADTQLTALYKRRCGVGLDLSPLRPSNSPVNNAALSTTGICSFMERFSNTTREVAMLGRRGALMLTLDCRHPDIEEFVNIKKDKSKVTGANISVMLRDDFMNAVKADGDYILRFPCNIPANIDEDPDLDSLPYNELQIWSNCQVKKIRAKELYNHIIENAWSNAEPGQIFIDKHNENSPDSVYTEYIGHSTNPCGEIYMGNDSCRLMSLNIYSIVENPFTDKAIINYDLLYEIAYEQQRLADDLVDLEIESIKRIIKKIKSDPEPDYIKKIELKTWNDLLISGKHGRRTGCGFTGLGDMLAALNLKYDSDEALKVIDKVMKTKMSAELDCTTDLAIERGIFWGWDVDKEYPETGIRGEESYYFNGRNNFYNMLLENFPNQSVRMQKWGRRNVSWSTCAPTGTLSILTQTTSGIEPLFAPYYIRRKKINPTEDIVADFIDQSGDRWKEYFVLHPKFKLWIEMNWETLLDADLIGSVESLSKETLVELYEKSPWYKSIANDIDWIKRIKVQLVIQNYTTHSISSTINIPADISKEKVAEIYIAAHENNLKGVTIYREGSRTGVLVNKESEFKVVHAPKRPKELDAEAFHTIVKGEGFTVVIGLLDEKPYEFFAYRGNGIVGKGKIVKKKRGNYIFSNESEQMPLTDNLTSEQEAITRGYSYGLRHSGNVKFAVEQLNKTKGDLTSFNKAIARVLKKYIPEGESATGATCKNCGANTLIYEEGCQKCTSCLNSKCG